METRDPIERLREYVTDWKDRPGYCFEAVQIREIADEIEAQYMRLPLDADGVPIHVGDVMIDYKTEREVVAVAHDSFFMSGYETDSYYRPGLARNHHHVKPDTVESLLEDFIAAYDELNARLVDDAIGDADKLFADYAERIRKAVEHE